MENIEALFIKWWEKTGNKHIGNTFTKLRAAFYDGHRQGRADQNEADVMATRTTEYYLDQPAETVRINILAAIRAAGPEEK